MSEQKTAKVTEVIQIREWSNPKGGTIYYHVIALDNGDKGSIGKKTHGAIKEGDSLTYTIDGDRIKEAFQQNGFGRGGFKSQGSPASFAVSYAKDIAIANIEKSLKPIEMDALADKILATADKFYKFMKERE